MKQARAADWSRRLREKPEAWRTRLTRFSFSDVPSLGTAEIPFTSPVTILSGPNGVGKTTLLRALWATLDPESAREALKANKKLVAGTSGADLTISGNDYHVSVEYSPDDLRIIHNAELSVTYIDSATDSREQQTAFSDFGGIDEIINGVGVKELNATDLSEINYLSRRDYRKISLYEVELDAGITAPFFEVAYGDDRYDSRTMGSGEISTFYTWWRLSRVDPDSILLIEEPEAFLSYGCQENFVDFLTFRAVKGRLCTVISSHSAPLIATMPKSSIRFLSRGVSGMQVVAANAPPILLKSVGIDPPVRAIIFVEDEAAQIFCRSLLEKFNASISRQVEIVIRNGESEITKAVLMTKEFGTQLKFLGLYDGDMKGKAPSELDGFCAYLPGDEALEILFRRMVLGDPDALATAAGSDSLLAILHGLEGADHHDWYAEVSKELGLTRQQLFPMLFRIWISHDENAAAAATTYEDIASLMGDDARSRQPPPGGALVSDDPPGPQA